MFCTSRYEARMVMGISGLPWGSVRATFYESDVACAIPRTSTHEIAWFCTTPDNPLGIAGLTAQVQMNCQIGQAHA